MSLIALAILAGVFYFFFAPRNKIVGLYEYIRKGYACIEEGKYEKGIKLLRKAYEELPGDEGIKKNLIYGYLNCAEGLENKGGIDQAIRFLDEAYDIGKENVDVAQRLAYLYCKRAVRASKVKRIDEAADDFQKGVNAARAFQRTRKSISVYLFNAAAEAYNKNERETVLMCLKSSYALAKRYEVFDFLGEFYYKESNLEAAGFYWQKALAMYPGNKKISDKLEKTKKDILVKRVMQGIKTEEFNVSLYKEYGVDAARLTEILKKIYDSVGKDLQCYPAAGTPIIFYSEADFRDIFKQPYAVQGFYDGSIRIPIIPDLDNPMFLATIAHEYTHAVASILTERKCPLWFNEGLACFEQARYAPMPLNLVRDRAKKGQRLSLKMLEEGFTAPGDKAAVALSYQGAYTVVCFMVDRCGWPRIRGLLGRIRDGRHYVNAVDEELLVSIEAFEDAWNEYVKKM